MDLVWKYEPLGSEEQEIAEGLCQDAKLLPSTVEVVMKRGIRSSEELSSYLKPSLRELHDPFRCLV